jgi:hypothetical protein
LVQTVSICVPPLANAVTYCSPPLDMRAVGSRQRVPVIRTNIVSSPLTYPLPVNRKHCGQFLIHPFVDLIQRQPTLTAAFGVRHDLHDEKMNRAERGLAAAAGLLSGLDQLRPFVFPFVRLYLANLYVSHGCDYGPKA